jgi:hypothetical protein
LSPPIGVGATLRCFFQKWCGYGKKYTGTRMNIASLLNLINCSWQYIYIYFHHTYMWWNKTIPSTIKNLWEIYGWNFTQSR